MLVFKRFRSALAFGVHEPAGNGSKFLESLEKSGLGHYNTVSRGGVGSAYSATVESQLKSFGFKGKLGQTALCFPSNSDPALLFVGLGKVQGDSCVSRDNIRKAGAALARYVHGPLDGGDIDKVQIGSFGDARALSEGYHLGNYSFDQYKQKKMARNVEIMLLDTNSEASASWHIGKLLAKAQNWARYLMELPSNAKTPKKFVDLISRELAVFDKVTIIHRDTAWIRAKSMNGVLAVAQGSVEPPAFLEIHYDGTKEELTRKTPVDTVLVGKGVTFDSGGISIKPSAGMGLMKGDLGGAAVSVAVLKAVAELELPMKLSAVIPLCENMPSGSATRPGDIIQSMNGKYIEIDNTDAEGRLILADALTYTCREIKPQNIIDIATLTGAMDVALGPAFTGFFSNSDQLSSEIITSGERAGDPFWRMPTHETYRKRIKSTVADIRNVGGRGAGACTAAAFLEEFVEGDVNWAHLDIAGVMHSDSHDGFNVKGMSGRPVRSIVELLLRK